jgi:hypothetical protein
MQADLPFRYPAATFRVLPTFGHHSQSLRRRTRVTAQDQSFTCAVGALDGQLEVNQEIADSRPAWVPDGDVWDEVRERLEVEPGL